MIDALVLQKETLSNTIEKISFARKQLPHLCIEKNLAMKSGC